MRDGEEATERARQIRKGMGLMDGNRRKPMEVDGHGQR